MRRILRIVGWNLVFILAGLLLIALAGEAYFRFSGWFERVGSSSADKPYPWRFVPSVGLLRPPHTDLVFHANALKIRTVQRANSLGFLDREPIEPARSAESCHISIIGDSFVEAKEVPLSDKLQVRLEEIATHEAPHLDVTTSAFGIANTGQVSQLPFYDGYTRHLRPDLVVLVLVENDFEENSPFLLALRRAVHPYHMARVNAARKPDGSMALAMPDPDYEDFVIWGSGSGSSQTRRSWIADAMMQMRGFIAAYSLFANWGLTKIDRINADRQAASDWYAETSPSFVARAQHLTQLPEYAFMSGAELPRSQSGLSEVLRTELRRDSGSLLSREIWGNTRFGLEQFKRRADHDGAALMILAIYEIGGEGDPLFDRLRVMAESLDIPVVSQHDYIVGQGGDVGDARWSVDYHWTAAGHRWAAGAIWEHVRSDWDGECPSAVRNLDADVDWIRVGYGFHTPDGELFAESAPALNPAGYEAVYRSVLSGSPFARSDWDVHLYADGLTYVKESCSAADRDLQFFLHVLPKDENDLETDRQEYGFDNVVFSFHDMGERYSGNCLASIDLPEYEISSIRTGQFVKDVGSDVEVWSVRYNFALPDIMDALRELQQSGIEPEIKSSFDVYINDDRLIYMKDYCDADDHDTPFFLHVFPADEDDLPVGREDSGFDNLGFELIDRGGMHDGDCFASVDLPGYEIASIRTGQVVKGVETWRAYHNFNFPETLNAVHEVLRSGREPVIRSNFNVYMDDGLLVYVKESCDADDRDLPFFLHAFPADENDLAEGREVSGFDNLGFELMQRGGMHDGGCFATVDLLEYDIASIRTGQWVRGEGEVWEARIEFEE